MKLNLLNKNIQGLELLDWPEIVSEIKSFATFEKTLEILETPPRARTYEHIYRELDNLSAIISNLEVIQNSFLATTTHLSKSIEKSEVPALLSKGHLLNINQLNYICNLIESFKATFKLIKTTPIVDKYDFNLTKNDVLLKSFVRRFRKIVSPNGDTNFENHPQLSKLYEKLFHYETTLRQTIRGIATSELFRDALQYGEHDVVNDRYVLAVRSDSYTNNHGLIIGKSSTGMTLFVEPYEMRERSNQRMRILAEIEELINRLCQDFCSTLSEHTQEIVSYSYFLIDIDKYLAKATFCHKYDFRRPRVHKEFKLNLTNYFHPLIENPILNSINIEKSHKGLVISGPNTGGKTVTLKCLSLFQLFLHFGLFLPIEDGDISPINQLYYFSHDHQDLTQGLSSFASETRNYLHLLEEINDESLIVVDEIFNSTSSEEASALAIGLLEEIHNTVNAKVIISTHHQLFKTLIHQNEEYISAHMSYDLEQQRPTYKLMQGQPGSSMALSIFEKLSAFFKKTTQISKRAQLSLDKKHLSYEELLQKVSARERELQNLLIDNRKINNELKNQKQSMEGILFLEKQTLLDSYRKNLDKVIRKAENLSNEIKNGDIKNSKDFNKHKRSILSEMPNKQKNGNQSHEHLSLKGIDLGSIKIGDILYSQMIKKNVSVNGINLRKKEVQIKSGTITIWTKSKELFYPSQKIVKEKKVSINIFRETVGKVEIDARGLRLDDFQRIVSNALDELISGDIPFLNVIHGHGAGTLKSWLRSSIKSHSDFTWEAEEGNDGCTKIILT